MAINTEHRPALAAAQEKVPVLEQQAPDAVVVDGGAQNPGGLRGFLGYIGGGIGSAAGGVASAAGALGSKISGVLTSAPYDPSALEAMEDEAALAKMDAIVIPVNPKKAGVLSRIAAFVGSIFVAIGSAIASVVVATKNGATSLKGRVTKMFSDTPEKAAARELKAEQKAQAKLAKATAKQVGNVAQAAMHALAPGQQAVRKDDHGLDQALNKAALIAGKNFSLFMNELNSVQVKDNGKVSFGQVLVNPLVRDDLVSNRVRVMLLERLQTNELQKQLSARVPNFEHLNELIAEARTHPATQHLNKANALKVLGNDKAGQRAIQSFKVRFSNHAAALNLFKELVEEGTNARNVAIRANVKELAAQIAPMPKDADLAELIKKRDEQLEIIKTVLGNIGRSVEENELHKNVAALRGSANGLKAYDQYVQLTTEISAMEVQIAERQKFEAALNTAREQIAVGTSTVRREVEQEVLAELNARSAQLRLVNSELADAMDASILHIQRHRVANARLAERNDARLAKGAKGLVGGMAPSGLGRFFFGPKVLSKEEALAQNDQMRLAAGLSKDKHVAEAVEARKAAAEAAAPAAAAAAE